MFYNEINEEKICFHVTTNELPESDTIIKSEKSQLGKMWIGSEWVDVSQDKSKEEQVKE